MQRKKILWIVSWYPNKNDRLDGDFIQRHARAAAIYQDVHVIFVTDAEIEKPTDEEWNYVTGLTEQIIYFKRKKGFAARLRKQLTWRSTFQQAVKNYIQENGLPDCVHVHIPWKAGLIALWMKKKYGKEFIVTEHWGMYNSVVEGNFYKKPKLFQALVKKIFLEAKIFVSVSAFLGRSVEEISGKKIDIIMPNVVDTSLFFFTEKKYSRFTFIHVSNMVPLKNVKPILDAFQKTLNATKKNVQLILIGNRNNEYVSYAEQLKLLNSSVFFKGEIPYTEVAQEMQRSHCLVLNSIMENSPCVIGEALCCGLPVIATKVGGIPELVSSTNSMIGPANDSDALAIAMIQMTEKYQAYQHKKIADEAGKKFGYSTIAQSFYDLYQAIC
jgi:glycosyltransferase involved in cell wall biosynthesis